MCGLFGFLRYGEAIKNLTTLTNSLAEQSAIRGTDATGIAFNEGGKLKIIKDGKSAYELDVEHGFKGSEAEWLVSLKGTNGKSAYELACDNGFEGTVQEWLESLRGADGKSAYELAVEHGFEGTEEEWFAKNGDTVIIYQTVTVLEQDVANLKASSTWYEGM